MFPRRRLFTQVILVAAILIAASGCKESEKPAAPAKDTSDKIVEVEIPLGLPALTIPADNPMTAAKIELGKMLYFETRLSKDKTIACATCHDPKMAWTEHKPTSEGIHGKIGERNSPTVINAAYMTSQFWDGRAKTLEEQALGPIQNPIEMGMESMEVAIAGLAEIPEYKERFQQVFGTGITEDGIAKAIAAFERTVLSGNSPYDRYHENKDEKALNEAQVRGLNKFMSAGCADCHQPPLFSNGNFYNTGVGSAKEKPDEGRKAVTKLDGDMGKFRVPHLRNVADTHPYFHDGSAATLADAVALMAAGGKDNPNLSAMMKAVRDAQLTDQDKSDMVEFLKGLSGEYPVIEPPPLP